MAHRMYLESLDHSIICYKETWCHSHACVCGSDTQICHNANRTEMASFIEYEAMTCVASGSVVVEVGWKRRCASTAILHGDLSVP